MLSEWDLSKFFDRSVDLLTIANFDGYFIKLNPSWTRLLGYTEVELTSRPFINFVHPDDIEKTIEATKNLSKDGQVLTNFTNRYLCKDGSIKYLMWSVWSVQSHMWAAARDITDLKVIEEEIRNQKKIFEKVANNIPGMVFQFQLKPNGERGFTYASQRALEIFEVRPEDLNNNIEKLFKKAHPDDLERLKNNFNFSATHLTELYWVGKNITPSGKHKWFEVRSTTEKAPDGTIVFDGILQDITKSIESKKELETARAETIQASKLSSLGEMAAGIAHEINNPLAIIHGYADRILRFSESGKLDFAEAKRLSEKILHGTSRIEKTVKSLSKLSYRKTNDVYENKLLVEVINDALNISNEKFHSSGIEIQFAQEIAHIKIECIPIEVSQAILNLLNNAYDAIEGKDDKWVRIEIGDLEQSVEIAVVDCGLGISPELQDRLWEPFFTSKEVGKGTGLGLSISRRLIEKHDGRLYIDTKSAHTRFVIELPKVQSSKKLTPKPPDIVS